MLCHRLWKERVMMAGEAGNDHSGAKMPPSNFSFIESWPSTLAPQHAFFITSAVHCMHHPAPILPECQLSRASGALTVRAFPPSDAGHLDSINYAIITPAIVFNSVSVLVIVFRRGDLRKYKSRTSHSTANTEVPSSL
jgi:hypothetical protein